MNWNDWPLERLLILFVGLAYLLIGVQVTLSHYRQNFHHKAMWVPVLEAPVFSLASIVLAFYRESWLITLFIILMLLGTVSGLTGFYFHFHGVGVRVGGYEFRNFLVGPPVILPLLFTAISALGLAAIYWG